MEQKRKKKNALQDNHYLQDAYEANFIHGLPNSTAMKITGDNFSWSTFMATYATAIAATTRANVY
jgi:hypothetical protein